MNMDFGDMLRRTVQQFFYRQVGSQSLVFIQNVVIVYEQILRLACSYQLGKQWVPWQHLEVSCVIGTQAILVGWQFSSQACCHAFHSDSRAEGLKAGIPSVWHVGCLACCLFGMLPIWHVAYLACCLFGMLPIWHVAYWACWLFGMLIVWHVACLAC